MKKMTKLLIVLLTAILLVGCGKKEATPELPKPEIS